MAHRSRFPCPLINNEVPARLKIVCQEGPIKSLIVSGTELGDQLSTIKNVYWERLKMVPYKETFLQQLLQEGYPLQVSYAKIFIGNGASIIDTWKELCILTNESFIPVEWSTSLMKEPGA